MGEEERRKKPSAKRERGFPSSPQSAQIRGEQITWKGNGHRKKTASQPLRRPKCRKIWPGEAEL